VKKTCLLFVLLSSFLLTVIGQEKKLTAVEEAAYTKTINQRADKIVATLSIPDSLKAIEVRNIIAGQYRDLNKIHTERNDKISKAKKGTTSDKEAVAAQVSKIEEKSTKELRKLHTKYLANLSKKLSVEQIEKVKDGMTYGVLPITYKGYQEMILTLTSEQKAQILAWLTEAREYAMDAESSEKKHAWFGKYKGRINNYLSAAGYDLRKEGDDWQKRIKETQAKAKGNS
jgi:hypothetical protein